MEGSTVEAEWSVGRSRRLEELEATASHLHLLTFGASTLPGARRRACPLTTLSLQLTGPVCLQHSYLPVQRGWPYVTILEHREHVDDSASLPPPHQKNGATPVAGWGVVLYS